MNKYIVTKIITTVILLQGHCKRMNESYSIDEVSITIKRKLSDKDLKKVARALADKGIESAQFGNGLYVYSDHCQVTIWRK